MNWFAAAVVVLDTAAAITYFYQGKPDHGLLWLTYGLGNIILIWMACR